MIKNFHPTTLAVLALSLSPLSSASFAQAILKRPNTALTLDPSQQPQPVASTQTYKDGAYMGQPFDAYYGLVQVKANIKDGRIVSVEAVKFPDHRRTSRDINEEALPALETEVIAVQSTKVHMVSGATLTARAYISSLASALRQAGN